LHMINSYTFNPLVYHEYNRVSAVDTIRIRLADIDGPRREDQKPAQKVKQPRNTPVRGFWASMSRGPRQQDRERSLWPVGGSAST
jgi:hypothetical protein